MNPKLESFLRNIRGKKFDGQHGSGFIFPALGVGGEEFDH